MLCAWLPSIRSPTSSRAILLDCSSTFYRRSSRPGAPARSAGKAPDTAKHAGDITEATVFERLTRLQHPSNLRRFDVTGEGDISDTTLPLARAVDVFVALRPNGQSNEPRGLIESLLFGTGRHLFLVPDDRR